MVNRELILPIPVIILSTAVLLQLRLKSILLAIGYKSENIFFAETLIQANTILEHHSASFAIIDLDLLQNDGIGFIKSLKNYDPTIFILSVMSLQVKNSLLEALSSGATAYCFKEQDDMGIRSAIRTTIQGGAKIDPWVAQQILLKFDEKQAGISLTPAWSLNQTTLNEHELEILNEVAMGYSNKEIAEHLEISVFTLDSFIKHIYQKLKYFIFQ